MKRAPLSLTDNMLCYHCKNFNNVSYVNSTIYNSKENYLIQLVTWVFIKQFHLITDTHKLFQNNSSNNSSIPGNDTSILSSGTTIWLISCYHTPVTVFTNVFRTTCSRVARQRIDVDWCVKQCLRPLFLPNITAVYVAQLWLTKYFMEKKPSKIALDKWNVS